jgi:acyl carrier protein
LRRALIPAPLSTQASFCLRVGILKDSRAEIRSTHLTRSPNYDKIASLMSEPDLRTRIKEMLVKNLMLQTTPDQIGDDLPLFGPNGLGLDSIDALELVVSMEKTFGVGVPNSEVAGQALKTVNTIHDYILKKRAAIPLELKS